jgi:hypothetical protein
MPREITIADLDELSRASAMGVLDLFSVDDIDERMLKAIDNLSATRVLVKLRSQPDFAVGRFIVLEVIDAPRLYGICRECAAEHPDRNNCYWVEPDLCSACAPRAHPNLKPEDSRVSPIVAPSVDDVRLISRGEREAIKS